MLASPILTSLIQYREFTATDTLMAAISLKAYALGLPAFILVKVLAPGFYARQDTRTPVRIGVIAMFCNIVLNLVLVWVWLWQDLAAPHAALALATSLSAYINAALLFHRLRIGTVLVLPGGWPKLIVQVLAATAIMGLVLIWLLPEPAQWVTWGGATRIFALLGFMLSGTVLYIGALALLGVRRKNFALQQQG